MTRQHLIFDADDTLWENNIYFERAFEGFVEYLNHSTLAPQQVRDVLDEIELANAKTHGYGSHNFGRNLRETYQRLAERHISDDDLRNVMSFAEKILECPIELIHGVAETLEVLSRRHDLTIFTKGDPEEQKFKIDRSGLGIYFGHTAIVKEKDTASYLALARERAMQLDQTWMIGNSPKSDVNPALAAGMNAVFIPHAHTWVLEQTEIQPGRGKLLELSGFPDLLDRF
jgi:putative hydrolase of the HAD superfamily